MSPNPQKELENCFNCGASLYVEEGELGLVWEPICQSCGADQQMLPSCCEGDCGDAQTEITP